MKIWFLYKITSLVSQRLYYGIHSSNDITWMSPRQPLTSLTGYDPLLTSNRLPTQLLTDITTLGAHRFSIEAIQGAPNRAEANRALRNALRTAKAMNQQLYNRPKGVAHIPRPQRYNPGRHYRKRIQATMKRHHHEHPRPRGPNGQFLPGKQLPTVQLSVSTSEGCNTKIQS
jgi:hypothetical protein